MKKWYRALWAKILLFILCIVSFATALASAAGIAGMGLVGVYWKSQQTMRANALYDLVSDDAIDIVHKTVNSMDTIDRYQSELTNLRYEVFAPDGSMLQGNRGYSETAGDWKYIFCYKAEQVSDGWYTMIPVPENSKGEIYTVGLYLDERMAVDDKYSFAENLIELMYAMRYPAFGIVIVSGFLFLFLFVALMCVSGRRPEDEKLHPGYCHRVPFDALLLFVGLPLAFGLALVIELARWNLTDVAAVLLMVAYAVFAFVCFLGLCMGFACRVKDKTLVSGSLLAMTIRALRRLRDYLWKGKTKLFAAIPMAPKMILAFLASALVDAILLSAMRGGQDAAFVLWLFKTLVVFVLLVHAAASFKTLLRASQALSSGDLTHRVETDTMRGGFEQMGTQLNDISNGMAIAVEQRTKSERMKAELVTNVSHDIKTPLTSIINYADLIAAEGCDNEKHREYGEVLQRKSVQLKRLLEDLVEISKANTDNLELDMQRMDAGILLKQAAGEFEERCAAVDLTLITTLPEEKIMMMADGRHMWRVFENLLGNAVKYSLVGSRVYADLKIEKGEAVFTLRNTSAKELNVSAEELTERFVRGDAARQGEGSGLGLSIAKSLVEAQKGTWELSIDGDLFKVTLKFPLVK